MNPFVQQLINNKVNSLTKEELVALSHQHQMPLTDLQAEKVLKIVHSETVNIKNKQQVERLIQRLQIEVDPYVSKLVDTLLKQFGHLL